MKRLFLSLLVLSLLLTSCLRANMPDETIDTEGLDLSSASGTVDTTPQIEPDSSASPIVPETMEYDGVSISLAAVGDNLIHPNLYIDANIRAGYNGYDFTELYSDIAPVIEAADISFINQETLMAGTNYGLSGYPCFNSPQELGRHLVNIGFDVIGMANNHMLDKMNVNGLLSTLDFWDTQAVTTIGGYRDLADSQTVRITEVEGVKIAWLTYTYGTNGIVKNANSPVVIPYIDDNLILTDIQRAKGLSDFVIVSIHWGIEGTQTQNAEQERLAALIANGGADLILGHHSHTLQPIEWIETDEGDKVLCIYSLGNFASGQAAPVNQPGGILTLDIVGYEGSLHVENVLFLPTVNYYGMDWYNTHIYWLSDYTDELAAKHGVQINGYYMSRAKAFEIVQNAIDDQFLPDYAKKAQ